MMLAALGETYGKKVSGMLAEIYWSALQAYSLATLSKAISAHMQDPERGQFWPKPADIIRQIEGFAPQQQTPEERAELAWMAIVKAMRTVGASGAVKLVDKQAAAALKAMGRWRDLCLTKTDNLPFRKRDFITIYTTLENTPAERLPQLPGMQELAAQKRGNSKQLTTSSKGAAK